MTSVPRVFIHAVKGLAEVAESAATAIVGASQVKLLGPSNASFVKTWDEMAGDLQDSEEHDVLVCACDEQPTPGVMASCCHALFRKRIPVLFCAHGSTSEALYAALSVDTQPLLTMAQCNTSAHVSAAVSGFLTPPAVPGRIFTVEGGDGAGKQTQTALVVERLQREGYPVKTMDFPNDGSKYGKEIRTILTGKYGSISQVSPLLFSTLYSMNRHDVKPVLQHWLRRGYNVVLDRWMESNYGHQAAKLEGDAAKRQLIAQLQAYECKWLGNPESHRVVYLDLPPEHALKAMRADATRATLDIHETAKLGYKESVRQCFLDCATSFDNWNAIPCVDGGDRLPRETVHEAIWQSWSSQFVGCSAP
eukprot:TRINITY_DN3602_c0_g1_i1.p1 TRINITY_DN3602_c0_g1~~TRINITY_DN3602_c0_g1_i1.p1  ORF type:complete len:379 (+),score=116.27 TRINITY_DN3602_c0_g1_i1:50-1138(+)